MNIPLKRNGNVSGGLKFVSKISLLLLFGTFTQAFALQSSILTNNFENYALGQLNGADGWTKALVSSNGNEGSFRVGTGFTNGNATKQISFAAQPEADIEKKFPASPRVIIKGRMYRTSTVINSGIRFAGDGLLLGGVDFGGNGSAGNANLINPDSSAFPLAPVNINQWYTVEIEADATTDQYRAKIDNGTWSVWKNFYQNRLVTNLDGIRLTKANGGTQPVYWDDIEVFTITASEVKPIIDWSFNGLTSSPNKFINSVGSTYPLTNTGVTSGTGKSGDVDGSIVINNTNQYLSYSPYNPGASDFTIAARVYATSFSSPKPIFYEEQSGATGRPQLEFSVDGGKAYLAAADANTGQYISSISTLSPNTWYDLVVSRSAGVYKMYINGILNNTVTYPNNITVGTISSLAYVGHRYNSTYSSSQMFWPGSIDAIKVYNAAVAQADVANIFASTSPTPVNSAPTISLTGATTISLSQGNIFTDPGATASDAEDGNIGSKIVTTGSVNTSLPGTYTITYKVTDNGGLSAQATRTVTVTVDQSITQYFRTGNGQVLQVNPNKTWFILDSAPANIFIQTSTFFAPIDHANGNKLLSVPPNYQTTPSPVDKAPFFLTSYNINGDHHAATYFIDALTNQLVRVPLTDPKAHPEFENRFDPNLTNPYTVASAGYVYVNPNEVYLKLIQPAVTNFDYTASKVALDKGIANLVNIYKNPTGSESYTIPYQQNLSFSLPVDGQLFRALGEVLG
jgi:hypothetical protein